MRIHEDQPEYTCERDGPAGTGPARIKYLGETVAEFRSGWGDLADDVTDYLNQPESVSA